MIKRQTQTLAALGWLLTYPDECLRPALPEIEASLRTEKWLPEKMLADVSRLIARLRDEDILDLQEDYVNLFDRTPSLSLHLFEHVHGDSRDRGPAMVDLDNLYRAGGLDNASGETPDYLPLFLEYLSTRPADQARDDLKGVADVVAAIAERLKKRGSLYAAVFDGIVAAAKAKPNEKNIRQALEMDAGALPDGAMLDRAWEEQFAFDKNPTQPSSCPRAEEMLARIGVETIKAEKRS